MRFTLASQCTAEILADITAWADAGRSGAWMQRTLADRGIRVSDRTVRNWMRGRVPHELQFKIGNAVPCGTRLRFHRFTGFHYLRAGAREGQYTITATAGRKGRRWLCWWHPRCLTVYDDQSRLIDGAPPVGLFSMRRSERLARMDAKHHCRTGEVLP